MSPAASPAPAFTLYDYVLSGNCYKIRLAAALLGVPYDSIAVDFYPGFEHRSEAMLALNPAGTLPVMKTADGALLTETNAMLAWLGLNHDPGGNWYPAADPVRGPRLVEAMSFGAGLTGSIGLARLHAMLDWPVDGAAAREAGKRDLRQLELRLTALQIDGEDWLAGGTAPSMADLACFPYVALSPDAGLDHDGYPAIRSWLYRVRSLPAFVTMPGIHDLHELR